MLVDLQEGATVRNITVAIDDHIYRLARLWCATREVSISRVIQTILRDLPRLENVRRFPLPEAPDPGSPGREVRQLELRRVVIAQGTSGIAPASHRTIKVPPLRFCDVKL
jgi:hypothetical protein